MDSLSRLKKALEGEGMEEVPVIPLAGQWIVKFSGIPLEEILPSGRKLYEAQVKAFEAAGYDALFGYGDVLYIPEAMGCPLKRTIAGLELAPLPIGSPEDIDRLPVPEPERDGRLPEILKAVTLLSGYARGRIPVFGALEGPFTTALRILEADSLLRKVIKDRPLVLRLLEKITEVLVGWGKALLAHGADFLFVADPATSSAMISPKAAGEVSFPFLKRLFQSLAAPCFLHICGNSIPILKQMVEAGAAVVSVDQCMDLAKVREIIGWESTLGGNVDPVQALQFGTPEAVRTEVDRCLRTGGNRNFVLMTGCAVPPGTPLENVRTLVTSARGYRFD